MERTRRRIAKAILIPFALIVLLAGMAIPASANTPMASHATHLVVEHPDSLNW
jgi:hypothetical protein